MEWYDWFFDCVKNKYADFEGRARRSEYWYFVLCVIIINVILNILALLPFVGFLISFVAIIVSLLLLCPGLAVTVRRLHDVGMSGWWLLLGLIPFVGLILLIFLVRDSQPGWNRFGDNPKY